MSEQFESKNDNDDLYVENGDVKSHSAQSGTFQVETYQEMRDRERREDAAKPEAEVSSDAYQELLDRFDGNQAMVEGYLKATESVQEAMDQRHHAESEALLAEIQAKGRQTGEQVESEDRRHDAEVAGRTVVAQYEARQATEAAQRVVAETPQTSQTPETPQLATESKEVQIKLSNGEKEWGRKYGEAARLLDELLASASYRADPDNPKTQELRDKIKQYSDLASKQMMGEGQKPGFGGMREIDDTIGALQDAIFVKRQQQSPGDKKDQKRATKIVNSGKNRYIRFV